MSLYVEVLVAAAMVAKSRVVGLCVCTIESWIGVILCRTRNAFIREKRLMFCPTSALGSDADGQVERPRQPGLISIHFRHCPSLPTRALSLAGSSSVFLHYGWRRAGVDLVRRNCSHVDRHAGTTVMASTTDEMLVSAIVMCTRSCSHYHTDNAVPKVTLRKQRMAPDKTLLKVLSEK